mgnify:CR=1 FL=1
MSLYVLSDTHLSTGDDKPMDVFGARWTGYTEKLRSRWNKLITDDDTVVIAGDISWAMSPEGAVGDLRFIDNLKGQKIIGRGNHDYWWSSMKKLSELCEKERLTSLRFLYNNAYETDDFIICGSRGWYIDESNRKMPQDADYQKIVAREAIRLELSLNEAKKLQEKSAALSGRKKEILVFLHFPPSFRGYECPEIIAVMKKFGITRCFFGHIHGVYDVPRTTVSDGISYTLTSADFLDFYPLPILPEV